MKLLVLICAALGFDTYKRNAKSNLWRKLSCSAVETVFPALTCPFQGTLKTGCPPEKHGINANGFFDREMRKAFFWEQSSELLERGRIWDGFRKRGGKIAQVCLQQSLGNDSDIIISPAPIHKHHGGMIQDCYSRPQELYRKICSYAGSKFNLFNYWGPFTSQKSSRWISAAIKYLMIENHADLIFGYIPHLDYDLQRYGVENRQESAAFAILENILEDICRQAENSGYQILILGDYQIENVNSYIRPNQILADKGFFKTRNIRGMLYPDMYSSTAFALCDHQIAELYILDKKVENEVYEIFSNTYGIAKIVEGKSGQKNADFTLVASDTKWFSYKWWREKKEAPDYATHVDIHNKPGYDPCELFLSLFPPMSVSLDDSKVKGSHGSVSGQKKEILAASTFLRNSQNVIEICSAIKDFLG